jgi:subtilisin-like proprotein convertase family protein
MNATMTRVNGICEKDLAIHMNIIANNTAVIYTNAATDPYTTMANWNGQLQTALTSTIGEGNYDIGHMFGATGGGGNAGCIGCVCVDGQKGSGITSPADGVPMGDNFDVDYVVHEMGHQYGGNHSFSYNVEGSGVNVEPGSGSTIMGYAGITSQDVQPHSDAYFVYGNVKQIQDNMVGKTCPVRTSLPNSTPTVNAGLDYTIPKSTPFMLTGTASDPNGDALTYCWEENDTATTQTGVGSAASATKTGGPNWRSYSPVASPTRYFPPLARVIANASTTQGTEIVTEALSSVARDLNFVLTVRDNHAGGGQTASDAMKVTVNATAGPFLVTAPNTALVSWTVGSNQNVTWDVAGTTANNVNAAYVDIYLSTDGGLTYPILLASQVPNDGTEVITVPNNVGTTNRVMVKGSNHIFYDISNVNFPIVAAASSFSASFNRTAGEQNKGICTSSSVSYVIDYVTYAGFAGFTNFSVTGQPAGTTVTFSPASLTTTGSTTMTISNTASAAPGFYSMIVTATSGAVTKTVPFYLNLFSSNFATTSGPSPADNAIAQPTTINLTWAADVNATQYQVQVASDIAFANIISTGIVTTNSYSLSGLSEATSYYWRVLPKNTSCFGVYNSGFKFTTGQTICATFNSTNVPLTIATTANVTVNSTITVADTDTISDVNVTMDVSHTWVNDMTITLISPAGTQVQLVNRPCTSASLLNIVATFDDSGVPVVCATDPAISSTVIPIQALSAFNGQPMNGTWTLRVFDAFNEDGGSLNSWSLNLCHTIVPLSVASNTINNFSLYPNPNKGNFNVQFNSTSNEDISINVFDIRGRNVYTNSYKNNGLFNENIQLNDLASGVYLVTVKDGQNQITKKFIKE